MIKRESGDERGTATEDRQREVTSYPAVFLWHHSSSASLADFFSLSSCSSSCNTGQRSHNGAKVTYPPLPSPTLSLFLQLLSVSHSSAHATIKGHTYVGPCYRSATSSGSANQRHAHYLFLVTYMAARQDCRGAV